MRFYSHRITMTWRALSPEALDKALAFARSHDYRPYFLIETEEQQEFVDRFSAKTPVGGLGWPATADINHMVRLYDPDDYARYRAGERITTERVWTKKERVLTRFKF